MVYEYLKDKLSVMIWITVHNKIRHLGGSQWKPDNTNRGDTMKGVRKALINAKEIGIRKAIDRAKQGIIDTRYTRENNYDIEIREALMNALEEIHYKMRDKHCNF